MKLPTLPAASCTAAVSFLLLGLLPGSAALGQSQRRSNTSAPEGTRVPVVFTGGYETDPQDRGRPVVLIAAALGVPGEVFRAAFRNVRPAPAGQEPDPGQVRRNKEALMNALARYGVTNERLDTVSNYYRYNGRRGETWRHREAAAYATVRDGKVIGFTITDPGAGYSSSPRVSLQGREQPGVRATLAFGSDFEKNGSISALTLVEPGAARSR
jgi:hypothetical protein